MFVVEAYGYVILAATMALGGLAGWLSGLCLKLLFRVTRRRLLDTLCGVLGSLIGFYIAFRGYSVYEEWYDGKLVSRHVGGWADHFILVAVICSVGLTTIIKTGAHVWSRTLRKPSNIDRTIGRSG